MKKNFKAIIAGVLSVAAILSMTACGGSTGDGSQNATTTEATTTARTTLATDENLQEQVGNLAETLGEEEIEVTKKITWLAWWSMDETQAAAELFKTMYGIPEEGNEDYGEDANNIFENVFVAYGDRYDKLATMISGGDSPDIFPFEIVNYPYTVYKGMFQPIDDYLDTTTEEWADYREVMDKFVWGGKNYCAITAISTNDLLWYRRSVVEEAGLDDPYELYKAGNWTWNEFLQMGADFQDSGEGKFLIDGFNPENRIICSTGTPLIGLVDGKLQCNLYDANVERAMEVISKLCTENYRYPRHELNNWSTSYPAWVNGDTLFFADGTWRFEEHWCKYRDRYGWDADEVFFVPFPRDPNSETYYAEMKQDAYMLCGGSDNVEGWTAWTKCVLAASKDENVVAAQREKSKNDFGWTDEQLDFLYELTHGAVSPVFDFKNGIGQDIASTDYSENCIESLTKDPYVTAAATYTQRRSENEGQITQRVEELNASISA